MTVKSEFGLKTHPIFLKSSDPSLTFEILSPKIILKGKVKKSRKTVYCGIYKDIYHYNLDQIIKVEVLPAASTSVRVCLG